MARHQTVGDMEALRRAVLAARAALDLTQKDVVERRGPSISAQNRVENGRRPESAVSRDVLKRYDKALGWDEGTARAHYLKLPLPPARVRVGAPMGGSLTTTGDGPQAPDADGHQSLDSSRGELMQTEREVVIAALEEIRDASARIGQASTNVLEALTRQPD